jgi:hypothetical protein
MKLQNRTHELSSFELKKHLLSTGSFTLPVTIAPHHGIPQLSAQTPSIGHSRSDDDGVYDQIRHFLKGFYAYSHLV